MTTTRDIVDLVHQWAATRPEPVPFTPGVTPVPVHGAVLAAPDYAALVEASLTGWLTSGPYTHDFQRALATYVGMRDATFVNSGSSANLVAISALTSPKLGARRLVPGDEVLTVAAGFPTTVNPILQNGLVPVVVDVELGTYNVDIRQLENAIGPHTKAIVLAHTLGNPFDVEAVRRIADDYHLWLIEDTCDALGSTYAGRMAGSFGDMSTYSFYPAHHITTGEGGAVLTRSPLLRRQVESFRDWGRDCYCDTGCDNTCAKRFDWTLGDLPHGYDHKFVYAHKGYNLKATDIQAALGLAQLRRIEQIVQARRDNFTHLEARLSTAPGLLLPRATLNSRPAWFGYPITLDPSIDRRAMMQHLTDRKVGTRLLFGGNLLAHPAYSRDEFRVCGRLDNSDTIMRSTFWIGVHPALTPAHLDYAAEVITDYVAGAYRAHAS